MVEAEWEQIRQGELRLQQTDIDIIKSHFDQHAYDRNAVNDRSYETCLATDPAFSAFVKRNVRLHREDGYRIVFASLKPVGGVTGDISAEQLDVMADLADRYSFDEARVTHDQNIVLGDVRKEDVYTVWKTLAEHRSEEHTSELQSLMRISYAVFCLKKKIIRNNKNNETHITH